MLGGAFGFEIKCKNDVSKIYRMMVFQTLEKIVENKQSGFGQTLQGELAHNLSTWVWR